MFEKLVKLAAVVCGAAQRTVLDGLAGDTPVNLVLAKPDHRRPPEMTMEQFLDWLHAHQSYELDQFALTGEMVCVLTDPPGEAGLGGKYGDMLSQIPGRRGWEFRVVRREKTGWWVAVRATSKWTKPAWRQGQINRIRDFGLTEAEAALYFDQGSKYRSELAPIWAEIVRRHMVREIAMCTSIADVQARILYALEDEKLRAIQAMARVWLENEEFGQ